MEAWCKFHLFYIYFVCGIVYPVMFVDGIVLLSQTMIGLQKQLNSLCHAGSTLKLKVHRNTSSKMVFRTGG